MIDRKWMAANRLNTEYLNGVEKSIKFAAEHTNNPNRFKCLCLIEVLREHLFIYGVDKCYRGWIWYGQSVRDRQINSDDRRYDEREEVDL